MGHLIRELQENAGLSHLMGGVKQYLFYSKTEFYFTLIEEGGVKLNRLPQNGISFYSKFGRRGGGGKGGIKQSYVP